jgi:hypothetical protein
MTAMDFPPGKGHSREFERHGGAGNAWNTARACVTASPCKAMTMSAMRLAGGKRRDFASCEGLELVLRIELWTRGCRRAKNFRKLW